ncbi:MAG: flagellin [Gemmatimonadota bacterium]|nr:flagellin [Gemmatimonadota bacterium]
MAGLTLNTNISAVNTRRNLLMQNRRVGRSMEKLSSGLKINRAADDAAGMTIAENLRAQVLGLSQAVANSQDAISLIQTAEGALTESHNILQRMRQLAIQSSNGTLTSRDRKAVQDEVFQLIDEIDRIALTTQFNSINLLNGNVGALVSTDDPSNIKGIVVDSVGRGGTFSVAINAVDFGKMQVQNSQTFVRVNDSGVSLDAEGDTQLQSISRFQDYGVFAGGQDSVALTLSSDVDNAIATVQVFATDTLSQFTQKISLAINNPDTTTDLGLAPTISAGASLVSISQVGLAPSGGGIGATSLVITTPEPGRMIVFGGEASLLTALGFNEIQSPLLPVFSLTVQDIGEGKIATRSTRVYGNRAGNMVHGVDIDFRTTLDMSLSSTETDTVGAYQIAKLVTNSVEGPDGFVIQVSPRPLSFQIGSNNGDFINTQIGDMTARSLGIEGLNISDQFLAQETLKPIDQAIDLVSAQRSTLGAVQNRLESTIANLSVAQENLSASESQIRDLDFSEEVIEFTSAQILTASGTSFLAQANALSNNILTLLQ